MIQWPTQLRGSQAFIDPGDQDDRTDDDGESEKQDPEPQAQWVRPRFVNPRSIATRVVERTMSLGSSCVELGFTDLNRNRRASIGLIQMSEAAVRKPPPATGVATREGPIRDRLRFHVIAALRANGLCLNRDTSRVTHRPLQRGVILHKKIHLSHIEPEAVPGGTDIELWAMACRNFNKILLTIGAFHSNHRIQTVARIGQVSTQWPSNRLEKQGFQRGYQRAIVKQCMSEESIGQDMLRCYLMHLG